MPPIRQRLDAFCVLAACAQLGFAACQDGDAGALDEPTVVVERAPRTDTVLVPVAGSPSEPLAVPLGTAEHECRPLADEAYELADYADDFFTGEPDVALTWRAPARGLYVAELAFEGTAADLHVLRGSCDGTELALLAGLEQGWPGVSFAAEAGEELTFVLDGPAETRSMRLSIALGCVHADETHCVRAGEGGEPACGVRYAHPGSDDRVSCEALHAPGATDEHCPSTTFLGARVEGCCAPDGQCGHLDPDLGCHDLAQADWAWSPPLVFFCDERAAPAVPDHFECSHEACERDLDCCAHPVYGNATCAEGLCVLGAG